MPMTVAASGIDTDGLEGSTARPVRPYTRPAAGDLRAQFLKQAFEHNAAASRNADAKAWNMLAFSMVSTCVLIGTSANYRLLCIAYSSSASDGFVPDNTVHVLCAAVAICMAAGFLSMSYSLRSIQRVAVSRVEACMAAQLKLAVIKPGGEVHSPAAGQEAPGSRVAGTIAGTDRAPAGLPGQSSSGHEAVVAITDAGDRANGAATARPAATIYSEEDRIWNEFLRAWKRTARSTPSHALRLNAALSMCSVMISATGAYATVALIPGLAIANGLVVFGFPVLVMVFADLYE